jgi:hypothetical protein
MMHIIASSDGHLSNELEWHVNEPKPIKETGPRWDYRVQADGDELEFIKDNFTNLPYRKDSRIIIYQGDFARFILDNL